MPRRWRRYSDTVSRTRRWRALRLLVLRRDGWCCRSCGGPAREVDHVRPVREAPELAYTLDNLQALCARCHARKTRGEINLPQLHPERARWREAVRSLTFPP